MPSAAFLPPRADGRRSVPATFQAVSGYPADVLAVEPCPAVQPGRGRVITGTFATARCEALEIRLAGRDEVLEPTPPHRFYSETRQDWLAAKDLRPGERLRTASGEPATVESVGLKPGRHAVYNLEVESEHQFFVGQCGALVHNAYAGRVPYDESDLAGAALDYRRARAGRTLRDGRRLDRGQGNVAVFEYVDDSGSTVTRAFLNRLGRDHAEVWGMRVLNRAGIARERVTRIYSELEFCADLCEPLLRESFPGVPRTWSFPYNTQRALGRQMKSEAVIRGLQGGG